MIETIKIMNFFVENTVSIFLVVELKSFCVEREILLCIVSNSWYRSSRILSTWEFLILRMNINIVGNFTYIMCSQIISSIFNLEIGVQVDELGILNVLLLTAVKGAMKLLLLVKFILIYDSYSAKTCKILNDD